MSAMVMVSRIPKRRSSICRQRRFDIDSGVDLGGLDLFLLTVELRFDSTIRSTSPILISLHFCVSA